MSVPTVTAKRFVLALLAALALVCAIAAAPASASYDWSGWEYDYPTWNDDSGYDWTAP